MLCPPATHYMCLSTVCAHVCLCEYHVYLIVSKSNAQFFDKQYIAVLEIGGSRAVLVC